jgi:hypothetical protein
MRNETPHWTFLNTTGLISDAIFITVYRTTQEGYPSLGKELKMSLARSRKNTQSCKGKGTGRRAGLPMVCGSALALERTG